MEQRPGVFRGSQSDILVLLQELDLKLCSLMLTTHFFVFMHSHPGVGAACSFAITLSFREDPARYALAATAAAWPTALKTPFALRGESPTRSGHGSK